MKGLKDFRDASDSEILDEMVSLLNERSGNPAGYIPAVSFYQLELNRRTVARLRESSTRLERLTKVLIVATVVLLVAALPGALDIISRFCSR
jgi:nitrate reductase gamma subunit